MKADKRAKNQMITGEAHCQPPCVVSWRFRIKPIRMQNLLLNNSWGCFYWAEKDCISYPSMVMNTFYRQGLYIMQYKQKYVQ